MSDVIRWTCEMVRSDIGGFVSNHDYQMAVEECDRLRAALSERDRMLNMARQNIAGDLCALGIQQSAIYAVLTRLDLSAYDASKREGE